MEPTQDAASDAISLRVSLAVNEMAKGLKGVSFYPPGHPSLTQLISKIVAGLEEIPIPEAGIEIGVTRNALLYGDAPLAAASKAVVDLNRELYLRRASKIIFLPNQKTSEVFAFLGILTRDIGQIQDEGGLERVLLREKVSRIWANRVDYEGLTEMLKKEEAAEPPPGEEDPLKTTELSFDLDETRPEDLTIEGLLARIEVETDPAAYRDLIVSLSRVLLNERADRKIEYASRAFSIFVSHIERPPRGSQDIAGLARVGIKEMFSEDLVSHFIRRLQDRGTKERREAEVVLVAFGDRAVKRLLATLSDEEDLLVRKSIVDVVVRIGRPALPAIIENLSDSRWYVVRNMVTIIGSLGLPDLAPQVGAVLSHPDLRVKKEAIKALSKLPHPSAVSSLGDLCFFPEETVALTATAALSAKKEEEAVLALYRRAVRKNVLYPHYRLAHEAIDSLRAIGTDEALSALDGIVRAKAVWETEKFRAMKTHALRSISKMPGERPKDLLRNALGDSREYLRVEAERLLKRTAG